MKPKVIWLFGLSGAGKSTIAHELKKYFDNKNLTAIILDGDDVRNSVNNDLGFSEKDRKENIRRSAEMAKLLVSQNMWVIAAFITPKKEMRDSVKDILQNHVEIMFIDTPIEECIKRDVKGLYKAAMQNQIKNFTGISDSFEWPDNENVYIVHTTNKTPCDCVNEILKHLNLETK
ncbi:MAG: adenylyl-sulfate kinase [Bacteroidia bacterium]|nr:adenylyl-sulfate kinase [Bacteroidia bacterium]